MRRESYIRLIELALSEDLGVLGDITSNAIFKDETGKAVLLSKDCGILAGSFLFKEVFYLIDSSLKILFSFNEGDILNKGDKVACIEGKIRSILKGERIALNFLSFISGIATKTACFVEKAKESGKAVILDTRKTLPGYRELSKYAVRIGGGKNHRMGLYDMVLIKDNHIDAAGGIKDVVDRVKNKWKDKFKIEVECRSIQDVKVALGCGADIILLDNMENSEIEEAVKLTSGRVKLEASGQMNKERIESISSTGVDFISTGEITKSVTSFDFSLDIKV